MNEQNNQNLKGVPETLLISLHARCNESIHPRGLINDPKSLEIAEKVGSDFRKAKSVHLTNVGTGIRTIVFDRYTQDFLRRYPDGTIVDIACGLDTRYWRLDNGLLRWTDLDLPEVIAIRKQLFEPNERYKMLAKSVLDFTWIDEIPKDKPVFLTAEGLACYLSEEEISNILKRVAKAFDKAEFAIEAIAPFMVKQSKRHPSLKGYDAQFRWGTDTGRVVDEWDTGFHFVDECFFMSLKSCKQRSVMARTLCTLFPKFAKSMKIFRIRNFEEVSLQEIEF